MVFPFRNENTTWKAGGNPATWESRGQGERCTLQAVGRYFSPEGHKYKLERERHAGKVQTVRGYVNYMFLFLKCRVRGKYLKVRRKCNFLPKFPADDEFAKFQSTFRTRLPVISFIPKMTVDTEPVHEYPAE